MSRALVTPLLALLLAGPLAAQDPIGPRGWSALRISKWVTLSATAAATVYGVAAVQTADRSYERLERACLSDPTVCLRRQSDGSYADQRLEAEYQGVRREDRRARNALLASQVGVVATVVLFVIDLRHARSPGDIPYEPRRFDVGKRRDGAVELRWRVAC